ncbi:hypothetical protein ABL78_2136 [Leptomonas seymouri]|uniref:RecA family profile 1 domain-containing protein n=1 Tax=Leptomonas seymouri TaxID=5684 RepID=A0A0N0P7U1_LEPSE|nr:hypothetical protein ABL78_2136 [Leptomonas seymouri]|eukprot:KPI88757.1 hypothetical protein ABL78_2136 [Leptomonas seymouri]
MQPEFTQQMQACPSSSRRISSALQPQTSESDCSPATTSRAAEAHPFSLGLEACSSVHDLLALFSPTPLSNSSDPGTASGQQVTASELPIPSGVSALLCSDVPPRPPARWDSREMKEVRAAIVRHLTGVFEGSPTKSMEDFFLFLVSNEQDVLRPVRQQCRVSLMPELHFRSVTDVAESLHDARAMWASGEASTVERAALVFMTQCAAHLFLRPRQSARAALGSSHGVCTSDLHGAVNRLRGCSALSLLRPPARYVGPGAAGAPYTCSTGCEGLDGALGGCGFRSGWVTEVYGEAGSGKTQLGLQCLLAQSASDVCRSAVAACLGNNPSFLALLQQQRQGAQGLAQRCKDAFQLAEADAARCALVYLVSEDVPTARLGPLATAAARRSVCAVQLHPLLTQLPRDIMDALLHSVRQACTVTMVLSRLQISHVASLRDVMRLVEPSTSHQNSTEAGPNSCRLNDAVRVLGGSLGRALIVLDSVAAAAVGGQSDMKGAAQVDASVAAVAMQLRRAAAQHNWCVIGINQVRAVPSAARSLLDDVSRARLKRRRFSSSPWSSSVSAGGGRYAVVPALGLAWSTVAQCRVHLRKSLPQGVRQLIVRQSPAHPPSQASYIITKNGIEDA